MQTTLRLSPILPAVLLLSGLSFAAQAAPNASATCDRSCLTTFARTYMDAMTRHDFKGLPLAANVKMTENAKVIEPGQGVFAHVRQFKLPRQFVAEARSGQIGVQAVLEDGAGEAIFAMRLKIENQKITEVETLVSHDGQSGPAFEPDGFLLREAPYIDEIPAAVRTPRADLLGIAQNYWTIATTTHDDSKVQYTSGCIHVENGMNTDWEHVLTGESFKSPAFAAQEDGRHFLCRTDLATSTGPWNGLREYRAFADEERGLVMIWNMVDMISSEGGPFPSTTDVGAAAEAFYQRAYAQGFTPDDIPAGLTFRGMAASTAAHAIYHAETQRIIRGKIDRHQVFMHILPEKAQSPWAQ